MVILLFIIFLIRCTAITSFLLPGCITVFVAAFDCQFQRLLNQSSPSGVKTKLVLHYRLCFEVVIVCHSYCRNPSEPVSMDCTFLPLDLLTVVQRYTCKHPANGARADERELRRDLRLSDLDPSSHWIAMARAARAICS